MMMMSSEEETECVVMQERLLKKSKRTRQRVDAGEPRNSYASIPNFSSRPASSSSDRAVPGVGGYVPIGGAAACSSSSQSSPPGLHQQTNPLMHPLHLSGLAVAAGGSLGSTTSVTSQLSANNGYSGSTLIVSSPSPNRLTSPGVVGSGGGYESSCNSGNSPGAATDLSLGGTGSAATTTTTLLMVQGRHHHHHNNHFHQHQQHRHHSLRQHRLSFDMGSDGEGGKSTSSREVVGGPEHLHRFNNGNCSLKEGEVAPMHHHYQLSSSTTASVANAATLAADDNSQLLREILQGGKQQQQQQQQLLKQENSTPGAATTSPLGTANGKDAAESKSSTAPSTRRRAISRSRSHHLRKQNRATINATVAFRNNDDDDDDNVDDQGQDEDNNNNDNDNGAAMKEGAGLEDFEEDRDFGEDLDNDNVDDEVDEEDEEEEEEAEEEEEDDMDDEEEEHQRRRRRRLTGILLQGSLPSTSTTTKSELDSESEEMGGHCGDDQLKQDVDSALERQQQQQQQQQTQHELEMCSKQKVVHVKIEDDDDQDNEEDDDDCNNILDKYKNIDDEDIDDDDDDRPFCSPDRPLELLSASSMQNRRSASPSATISNNNNNIINNNSSTIVAASAAITTTSSSGGSSAVVGSSSAVAELKRARVENIISSMRSSPSRTSQLNEVPQVNGCKKRKLYMPQQHEVRLPSNSNNNNKVSVLNVQIEDDNDMALMSSSGGPSPCKQRRVEQDLLRRQLTQMQAQIAAIQHKLDLCDGPSSDNSDMVGGGGGSQSGDDGGQQLMMLMDDQNSPSECNTTGGRNGLGGIADGGSPRNGLGLLGSGGSADGCSPLLFHLGFGGSSEMAGLNKRRDQNQKASSKLTSARRAGSAELDPAHFIDEARRLVHEQEQRLTKEAEMEDSSSGRGAAAAADDHHHHHHHLHRHLQLQHGYKMQQSTTSSVAAAMTVTTASPAEPKVAATAAAAAAAVAAASGPVPRPPSAVIPPDWETLADVLKLGMSSLIDDWVRRCAMPTSSKPFLISSNLDGPAEAIVKTRVKNVGAGAPMNQPPTSAPSALGTAMTSSSSLSSSPLTTYSVATSSPAAASHQQQQLLPGDRRSPRTKVIDRGRMGASQTNSQSLQIQQQQQHLHLHQPPPASLPPPPPPPPPPAQQLQPPLPPHSMATLFGSSSHFAELHLKPPSAMFPPPPPPPSSKSGGQQHQQQSSLPSGLFAMAHHPHHHPHLHTPPHSQSIFSYGLPVNGCGGGGGESPEQSEALPLVVAPKKKRHKVTDTRITPRTVSRLLGHQSDSLGGEGPTKYTSLLSGRASSPVESGGFHGGHHGHHHPSHHLHHHQSPIVPVSLPTSVAIPNPSLHQSDVFSPYPYFSHHGQGGGIGSGGSGGGGHHHPRDRGSPHSDAAAMMDEAVLLQHHHHQVAAAAALHSSLLMGSTASGHGSSPDPMQLTSNQLKAENGGDSSDCNSGDLTYDGGLPTSSTLTPMHLRKAKLMFFYVRYPSSAILKTYFPDIKFNKNNTAQLVKWFSNFREFFYIQMEKYARQALSEGCKGAEELMVNTDSELYRVLNLHYNRNNHIEVPTNFRYVVESTLREFFKSIVAAKDTEQSWKKAIYKVIARLDDNLPEYFKSPNFLEQLE